jgi:quinoprotein glucose dehydrogenase
VFLPTGSAAPDYYGGLRLGDNRYANSLVALRASTGKLVWSFQTVHHDIWDYDNASPPALVTLRRGARSVDAVVLATKTGMLFVLNRETGEPVFAVVERPVPANNVADEVASRTQPFSSIAPLSPQRFDVDDIWAIDDADRSACRAAIEPLRNEGIFTPPSVGGTLTIPSNIGGAHWGGVAIDPERALAVVPVNRLASMVELIPREGFDLDAARRGERRLGKPKPMSYRLISGAQYVAVAVGGGDAWGAGDYVVAFRLP